MTKTTIDGKRAAAEIQDGRVNIAANGRDVTVRVATPNHTPLSAIEEHAKVTLSGDGWSAHVELDREARDALVDALTEPLEGDDE